MDPNTPLDHALFQLTPTRTRCDLLVFSGGACEKLASGLLEPFLSHLRCAKEQIPKGGYSITLRPDARDPSWFTRATLERFVRFVSTPEILERFVSIEREISHIESSINLNDFSTSTAPNPTVTGQTEEGNKTAVDGNTKKSSFPSKLKGESNGDEAAQEENSKLRLQRVLETRKAVLRKEQAMAYARAFVAGFEEDHIDDLIAFSDAFGASRLREACLNFKELCKKKHGDGLWMDELAAIEACSQPELSYMGTSGIVLTSQQSLSQSNMLKIPVTDISNGQLEQNGSSDASTTNSTINHANSNVSEDNNLHTLSQTLSMAGNGDNPHGKTQVPMTWPNQPPQYMYNFQSPVVPQMHPYQGYPFHGMQAVPLYYPGHSGNMQLPPHMEESGYGAAHHPDRYRHRNKSSKKKDISVNGKGAETSEPMSGHSGQDDSTSGSESDAGQQDFTSDGNPSTVKLQKKRSGKKSSRMVVIRNINYISSKSKEGDKDGISNESSVEDDFIDGNAIKQKVEDVVDSLQKHQKSTQRHSKRRSSHKHPGDVNISNGASESYVESNPFGKVCEGKKRDENWCAFQNLLMRDEESGSNKAEQESSGTSTNGNNQLVDVQDEYCLIRSSELVQPSGNSCAFDSESKKGIKPKLVASDSFVVTERDVNIDDTGHLENFECDENYCKSLKKSNCIDGELLLTPRVESDGNNRDALSDYTHESSSILKSQRGGDWFIITPEKMADGETNGERSMFDGDRSLSTLDDSRHTEKSKKDFLIDDSFVVPTRTAVDDQPHSQWRTDISIVTDLDPMGQQEIATSDHLKDKCGMSAVYEPDDLYMVLERDPRLESVETSWTPEIDYSMDISFSGADKKDSGSEANGQAESIADKMSPNNKSNNSKNEGVPMTKPSSKVGRSKPLHGSLAKSRSEIISRNKRPIAMSKEAVLKGKLEKEEENRKKMEELLIQRQNRIAQRSTASCTSPATSKESKTAARPFRNDKQISRPPVQEVKRLSSHKSDVASSTKECLTSGQSKNKGFTQLKSTQSKNISKKGDGTATNQSLAEKNTVQKDNCSERESSDADQISGPHACADTKQKLLHSLITSSADKTTEQIEPRNLPENISSDANPISGLDISDDKKDGVCSDLKEMTGCNSGVQNDSSLLHCPPSSLVEIGLDSLKQLEVDYERNAAAPVGTPKPSPQFQEGKTNQYMPASQANGCIDDVFLAPNSSQNNQISISSETKVNLLPTSVDESLKSADVGVKDNGTAHQNNSVAYEISEIEIISEPFETTPPPINCMNSETLNSRKKWTSNEGHPPTKGSWSFVLQI